MIMNVAWEKRPTAALNFAPMLVVTVYKVEAEKLEGWSII